MRGGFGRQADRRNGDSYWMLVLAGNRESDHHGEDGSQIDEDKDARDGGNDPSSDAVEQAVDDQETDVDRHRVPSSSNVAAVGRDGGRREDHVC